MTHPTPKSLHRFARFVRAEASGGIVMLLATALAILAANSAAAPWYDAFTHAPITFAVGAASATEPLAEWVKDILMVLFFLTVGMELKREMREGVLRDKSQILLPLVAALGGMLVPAAIFLAINRDIAAHLNGWAIPTATDIAFALAVLLLCARNVPPALKIFLLAIAIFDDLGAIAIIALFYSHGIAAMPLLLVAASACVLYILNRCNITALWPYLLTGVALWFFLYHGGIHPTIGGVMVGLAIPLRDTAHPSQSPLNRCMHFLHPWVTFLVLPLFAFTAAGISLAGLHASQLVEPLTLGIVLGLFLGKQIGIFASAWLLILTGCARLPEGTRWRHLYGASLLAGIGFTMSLFIGSLAFADAALKSQVTLGVMTGSLLAALAGAAVLRRA